MNPALILTLCFIFNNPQDSLSSQTSLGEELITAGAEMKITEPKYYYPPHINPWTPINDILTPERYIFDEPFLKSIDSLTLPQYFLSSSFLRVPVPRSFLYGDILVFLPAFEKRVATWELIIANSLGETVRRFRQKGQPPAVITWDGRTDQGELIATGDVYSFTFHAYDAQGNQARINCEPQRINAIVYQQGNERVASIAADVLFGSDNAQLIPEASARLDEVSNLIKEGYKKEVVVYVYTEKEKLALDRCRVLELEIGRRLVLPRDAFKVAPRFIPGLQPKYSRVEVHIL